MKSFLAPCGINIFAVMAAHGGSSSKVKILIESGSNFKITNKRTAVAVAVNIRIG